MKDKYVVIYENSESGFFDCNSFDCYEIAVAFARSVLQLGYIVRIERVVIITDWR